MPYIFLRNWRSDGCAAMRLVPKIEIFLELKKINLKLWDIEDGKRNAEKNKKFDERFIELARNVYKFNDERAKIKLKINNLLGSNIKEVKSYD